MRHRRWLPFVHESYTIHFPSGEARGFASELPFVNCIGCVPSRLIRHICSPPFSEMKTMLRPSGVKVIPHEPSCLGFEISCALLTSAFGEYQTPANDSR